MPVDGPPDLGPRKPTSTAASVKEVTGAAASSGMAPSATALEQQPSSSAIKYKGVYFQQGCWRIRFRLYQGSGIDESATQYETAENAARAYDSAARKYVVDPNVNFLDDGSLNPDRHKRKLRRELRLAAYERLGLPPILHKPRKTAKTESKQPGDATGGEEDGEGRDEAHDWKEKAQEQQEQEEAQQPQAVPQQQHKTTGEVIDLTMDEQRGTIKQEQDDAPQGQPAVTSSAPPTTITATPGTSSQGAGSNHQAAEQAGEHGSNGAGHAPGVEEVLVELKKIVFKKLMSVDGPALSEDEARKYRALFCLLDKPTASLRKLVEDVVLQSDYNAVVAERVAGLLADMVEKGHFDE